MAEIASPPRLLSIEEYLAFEEASEVRHEYIDGDLYAFAGASWAHSRIGMNIARRLLNATDDSRCLVFYADMMVRASERVYYYPDLVVTCDERDLGSRISAFPCTVIEILSPTTESIDRREKLMAYRALDTVQAYLIVSTDERRVARHWRDEDGTWRRADVIGDGLVAVPCLDTELALADIYRGVEVPAG